MIKSMQSLHDLLRECRGVPTVGGIPPSEDEMILRGLILELLFGVSQPGVAAVVETLLGLTQVIPATACEKWNEVFGILGCAHSGMRRFDLILGVARAAEFVAPQLWLPLWIRAGAAAKIHPVSHLTCICPETSPRVREIVELVVRDENARHGWFSSLTDIRDIEDLAYRGWILELATNRPITNLLAAEPVALWAAPSESAVVVGNGCCLFGLNGATNLSYRTIRVRDNAIVVGDINACSIPQVSVARGCQVGGDIVARRILEPGFTACACGVQWKGVNYEFHHFHAVPADGSRLANPVVIPHSLGILVSHLDGCAWLSE